jgi:cyanophycinase
MKRLFFLLCLVCLYGLAVAQPSHGPSQGNLIVVGGGRLGPEIIKRFVDLAGGPDAPVVMIPTARWAIAST